MTITNKKVTNHEQIQDRNVRKDERPCRHGIHDHFMSLDYISTQQMEIISIKIHLIIPKVETSVGEFRKHYRQYINNWHKHVTTSMNIQKLFREI